MNTNDYPNSRGADFVEGENIIDGLQDNLSPPIARGVVERQY